MTKAKGSTFAKSFALFTLSIVLICISQFIGSSLFNSKGAEEISREEVHVVPSPKVLSLVSLGQERSLGDLLMVKLVLYIGEKGIKNLPIDYVMGILKDATLLDPDHLEPYSFAFYLLSFNKKAIPRIIGFLKEGMKLQPQQWRLPLWISLLYKWELKETEKARRWAMVAASYPDAPPHVKRLPTYLLYKEGRYQAALEMLSSLYENSKSEKEKRILEKKIRLMKDLILLNTALNRYRSFYHRPPGSLKDLVKAGILSQIPSPPYPKRRYALNNNGDRVVLEGW